VKYNGRAIDFRVSIMPSIHAKTRCCACSTRVESEKFRTLTLDVVGFDRKTCASSALY